MPTPTPPNTAPHLGIQGTDMHVLETTSNGTYLGTLLGTDNEGDAVSFSLLHDAGGRFAIVNGRLVVADSSLLDYETASKHDIVIRTMDSRGAYRDSLVRVYVSDVEADSHGAPPPPAVNQAPVVLGLKGDHVTQHCNPGNIIGYVEAVDPDGYTLTYSLVDSAGGRFALTRGNQIVVANGAAIDYATAQSHTIKVRVQDIHGGSHEEELTVHVYNPNSGDPVPVPPSTPAGAVVGTEGNDTLNGNTSDQTFYGLGGDDDIHGNAGNDWIDGGAGNDDMWGGEGNDTYVLETGNRNLRLYFRRKRQR